MKPLSQAGRLWLLFGALALSNTLLSYAPLPPWAQLALLTAGVLLPLGLVVFKKAALPAATGAPLFSREFLPPCPAWGWALLWAAALFLRFYKLTTFFDWPSPDEATLGMSALRLSEKWDWRFFYTFGQVPPLPIWSSALLLKAGLPVWASLWLPSAAVSVLTLAAGYLAAREFFSRSFAFLAWCLLAFGYWPFLMGRFCHQGAWLPLWAFLALVFLGRFQKARAGSEKNWRALCLGAVVGLGSFTFTPWPFFALAVAVAAFGGALKRPHRNLRDLPFFLAGALAALVPFLTAVAREGYGQHIRGMSAFSGWFSVGHQALTVVSYLTELLWGTLEKDSAYVAAYGGMLNPILGAAFLLGLVQTARLKSLALARWCLLAMALAMLPGLLSMNVEMFRVAAFFPFLFLVTALGLAWLFSTFPLGRRGPLLALLVVSGAAIDATRVCLSRANGSAAPSSASSLDDRRALDAFRQAEQSLGPGYIFTQFTQSPYDPSLYEATYAFNALENPRLSGQARWAGLVTDVHYHPFLAPRFPGAVWYRMGESRGEDPEVMVGVLPVNDRTREALDRWRRAEPYFKELGYRFNAVGGDKTYREARDWFLQSPGLLKDDPFLESCYWERRAKFDYDFGFSAHAQDLMDDLGQALREGYPSAWVYYQRGSLEARKGDTAAARKDFKAALAREPGNRDYVDALSFVGGLEKKKNPQNP